MLIYQNRYNSIVVNSLLQVRENATSASLSQLCNCLMNFETNIKTVIRQCFSNEVMEAMNMDIEMLHYEDGSDEWDTLQEHCSFVWRVCKMGKRFLTYNSHVPWVCQALLSENSGDLIERIMEMMKVEWDLVLQAEASNATWLGQCAHTKWQCCRELMTGAQIAGWKMTDEYKEIVEAWFPIRTNTIALENTFNALRDAESRHSKHKRASAAQIAALTIKTTNRLFDTEEGDHEIVEPPASLLSQIPKCYSNGLLKRDALSCDRVPISECGIEQIWDKVKEANRTSPAHFVANGLAEMDAKAHMKANNLSVQSYLWVAGTIPEGSVTLLGQ